MRKLKLELRVNLLRQTESMIAPNHQLQFRTTYNFAKLDTTYKTSCGMQLIEGEISLWSPTRRTCEAS